MADQSGEPAAEVAAGAIDAHRRADDAGARTAYGRQWLRDTDAGEGHPERVGDQVTRVQEWTAQAQDQAARMHDSAAALHDQAVVLGIGDEQDHRRRAERHRAAAQSNRRPAEADRTN
ncbi:MAG TPA: hypothetical protein VF755_02995 [Catenuloplanes sp.]